MIYLDSAATSMQKPPAVALACSKAINQMATPGRGGHKPAMLAAETAFSCREEVAALFHVPTPEQVVFTFNATHGLNIAIKTLVKPGSRVVISGYEHNAVTRPVFATPGVTVRVARGQVFQPEEILSAFQQELEQPVDVVICTHVSNVFGYVLPIQAISRLCNQRGVPLIVDASQSAGCLPVDFMQLGAAFVAMPGHKGLYGPQGTGLLLCGVTPKTLIEGGTGSESINQAMPSFLPDRLEAGTHNVAGIAGLLEGVRYVRKAGLEAVCAHERHLIQRLGAGLQELSGLQVFLAQTPQDQVGVLSFRMLGRDLEELGEVLGDRGYALRVGLHCAPIAHQTVGTLDTGTVRASVSAFNTEQEIVHFLHTMKAVLLE